MTLALELQHKEIISKISQFNNGVAAESMHKMGLKYKVNHGLSLPQIDKIASAIIKSNQLALYLWSQVERESKLIAVRIFSNYDLNKNIVDEILEGITNVELAEQSAIKLLSKIESAEELASDLIQQSEFKQLAGYVLIARLALSKKDIKNEKLSGFVTKLEENLPENTKIYMKRGYAQAFLRIGMKSDELKLQVEQSITRINKKNQELGEYLNQEVIYFLKNN